ncbi:MAG: DUF882 domain-containing protein [Pseudolabrys sp.]
MAQLARCTALATIVLAAGGSSFQHVSARGDTRTLSFHNVHTGEDLTVTFKRNGQYDEAALKKLNWFMRDWRRSEEVKMDPQLFDVLWEAYQAAGASEPVNVICGYRSPETNSMLRARSRGVAQGSLHTHGQAMDFFIPGVPLSKIREVGLKMQKGGVGFYPSSGSPFVHLDVGTIRHWPRMSRDQLVKVFPDERTVHIPSDGKPLAGFALALADVERQGRAPSNILLADARSAGAIDEDDVTTAATTSRPAAAPAKPKGPTLLASFFAFKPGLGGDEKPKAEPAKAEPKAIETKPETPRIVTASLTAPTPVAVERIVPMPKVRPGATMTLASLAPTTMTLSAAAAPTPMPRMRPAAAPVAVAAADLFDQRGLWASIGQDKADELTTASTGPVLAYAPQASAQPARAVAPMGGKAAARISAAPLAPARTAETPAPAKLAQTGKAGQVGQRFEDPWMRAVLMTPSVRGFMTTAQMVRRDNRVLQPLIAKPDSAVMMAFSDDPQAGMTSDRFSGDAVVFVATATFRLRTTAALVR